MARFDKTKNWSEFDWERELRKDDERINNYLQELSHFIDLPGEEEMIIKSLQNHSKLVPMNINNDEDIMGTLYEEDFDPEEEFIISEDWRKKDDAIIYTIVEKLTTEWSEVMASQMSDENKLNGMTVITYYSKLLARISEVLGITLEFPVALRIALCKRIIATINDVLGVFEPIRDSQESMRKTLASHQKRLQIVREKIIDQVEKFRTEPPAQSKQQ